VTTVHTQATVDLTPRLRLAADHMEQHGWTQGEERNDQGEVCLTGAIRYCAPQTGDEYLIREVLRRLYRAEAWNDSPGRTEGEVLDVLRTTEITDADLAETFGPQWEHIVALVRRVTTLTQAEAERLDAARVAARVAAWDAARDAARDAAWDAARDAARDAAGAAAWDAAWDAAGAAARDAAWDAARDATWDAAGDAAEALALRDLVGKNGFTQGHYDTLTTPWRTVIGRIHPDDADLIGGDSL